uniref:Ankyrin repeat and SOCS box protein 11 n=1 Tax=Salvator merianae TaxID=96440 RepID=A0A8D0EDV2_SALMN
MFLIARGLRDATYGNYICHSFQGGSWADRSPLHEAAFQGQLLTLKTLVAQGFNVNIVTIDRVSALHEACLGGHVACAKVLLEHGARVNAATLDGITPLFNACYSGSAACVNILLEYGARPQLENHYASPIHEAVKRGHRECMEVLLANDVDLDQEHSQLGTPLYVACMNQRTECVKKLLELGPPRLSQLCRLCIRKCLGRSCLHVVHKLHLPERLENFLLFR